MVMLGKSQSNAHNAKMIGSGEVTLVLSHGYGADQSIWDDVVPDLARRCRVVVFDWNFSGAVDHSLIHVDAAEYCVYEAFSHGLISLIEEMSLQGVVFVGHSMAGMIGCIAAVKRPELFRRLVLLAASPRYLNSSEDGYEGGFERSEVEAIFTGMESDFSSWARSFAGLVAGGSHPSAAENFGSCLLRMRPEVALALARAVFLSDHRAVLRRVQVPCTVVSGTNDAVVPASVARYMQSEIGGGGASMEMLDFDGHFPQLTACQTLVDVLDGLLRS